MALCHLATQDGARGAVGLPQEESTMSLQENVRVVQAAVLKRLHGALFFLLVFGLVSLVPSTQADDYFTDESLEGVWGFSAAGTIVPPAVPAATPAVAVGTMTFDGHGGCSIADTINIGGISASRTSTTCTYTVHADGTGSLSVVFPGDPGPTPLAFVIVNDADEMRFIRTDLGVASGVAKRQDD